MKRTIGLLFTMLLTACGSHAPYNYRDVDLTVTEVLDDTSWNCFGKMQNKSVLSYEGTSASICGYYGKSGTKVKGCVISGHPDGIMNGLHADSAWCEGMRK